MDLDFYWSMIETKELYFKNSPLETREIASKHVLYSYISLTTFLVSKLQSFAVNAWICFVKAMGTHALQIQSFGFVKVKFPSLSSIAESKC